MSEAARAKHNLHLTGRQRFLAGGLAAALLLAGSAVEGYSLATRHEHASMSVEQSNSLYFREALKFYTFLNGLKPGQLTDKPPHRFQRVIVVDGQMVSNPISPLKVDVASQIVYATQTLVEATGGNSQNAEQLMKMYTSLTTPETRALLGREGISVQTTQPSSNGLGASGLDKPSEAVYNVDFITDSNGVIAQPPTPQAEAEFSKQLVAFQHHIALQGKD